MSEDLQPAEPENRLVAYQPQQAVSLFGTDDPVEVIAKAARVASALKDVIVAKGLVSKIQGKEYPKCEAWTLLGTMLGVFPVTVWTRPIEGGWEARTEARTRDGAIVGAAEAMCLRAERNWKDRDEFALRSMAATRSVAKALRMPLGFVMSLSGIEPTPSEEMSHDQPSQQPTPRRSSPKVATEKTRAWWLTQLFSKFDEQTLTLWAMDRGHIQGGSTLQDWPLEHIPTSKSAADVLLADCLAFSKAPAKPKKATPQSELEAKIIAARFTFDQFIGWAKGSGNLEDETQYPSFDDLPTKKTLHWLVNLKGILKAMHDAYSPASDAPNGPEHHIDADMF